MQYISHQFGKPNGVGGYISTWFMNRLNQRIYKAVLKKLDIAPNDHILDIGFGNGYLIEQLIKTGANSVAGIDISPDMVKQAVGRNQTAVNEGKVMLCEANVANLPFKDDTFNKIFTINTFYFWDNADKCFQEIKRTLTPGGYFINAVYTRQWLDKLPITKYDFRKIEIEDICRQTVDNGFEIESIIPVEPGKSYCLVALKK